MMKTLVIVAHPNLRESRVNKRWAEEMEAHTDVTVHRLYDVYPDFAIDVEKEQRLLLDHDRIVLQFPFYWYSTPALLKKWFDDVLTFGWAYGPEGDKLHGKELAVAVSAGGPLFAYQAGGYNHYSMSELLKPIQATSNLIGTHYLAPFVIHGVRTLTDEGLEASAKAYVEHILDPQLKGRRY